MSTYGTIDIPSPGPHARNTDALEALLALCRSLGLHYTLDQLPTGATAVTLTQDGPLDARTPYATRRTYSVVGIPGCAAPEVLRLAMVLALEDLRANAEAYRRLAITAGAAPVQVTPDHTVVQGHHRVAAAQALGVPTLPVEPVPAADDEA